MALRDWIFNNGQVANAIPAIVASPDAKAGLQIAGIAKIALARTGKPKTPTIRKVHPEDGLDALTKPLPPWCSTTCACLDEIDLPDGKIFGCWLETTDWKEEWKRLDSLEKCPRHRHEIDCENDFNR